MRQALALLPVAALLAPIAAGQDAADRQERFELYNTCRPMELVIESLSDDAEKCRVSSLAGGRRAPPPQV